MNKQRRQQAERDCYETPLCAIVQFSFIDAIRTSGASGSGWDSTDKDEEDFFSFNG